MGTKSNTGSGREFRQEYEVSAQRLIQAMETGQTLEMSDFQRCFSTLQSLNLVIAAGLLRRIGINSHAVDADDACQTWNIKMITGGFNSYLLERGPFFPFASTAMYRICVDIARLRRDCRLGEWSAIVDRKCPVDAAMKQETNGIVDEAMSALRPEERLVIQLRYKEGLRTCEIGARTGIKDGTIDVQIHRGLLRLRADLERRKGDVWPCDCP